jgi:ribosomal protein L37AE/L43A
MPDFRRIDDPSRQARLAEAYDRWNGMPGNATYRIACHACGKTFYARLPTAKWCCYSCDCEGAKRRRPRPCEGAPGAVAAMPQVRKAIPGAKG